MSDQEKVLPKQPAPVSESPPKSNESQSDNTAGLLIAILVFVYNFYAVTYNVLYAMEQQPWVHIIISVLINLAILFSFPNMLKAKFPSISNNSVYGAIFLFAAVGCVAGYYSGNPYTNEIKQYYNDYYRKSYNAATQGIAEIDGIVKSSGDPGVLKYLKYDFAPKLEEYINEADSISVPVPLQDDHDDFVKLLNRFKILSGDIVKGIEAQNALSIKAAFDSLRGALEEIQDNSKTIQKIAKKNNVIFTVD